MEKELYEHIEAYLDGSLDDAAHAAFEARIAADPALAAEVRLHAEVAEALHPAIDPALRQFVRKKMGRPHLQVVKKPLSAVPRWSVWLVGMAATVLLLVVGREFVAQRRETAFKNALAEALRLPESLARPETSQLRGTTPAQQPASLDFQPWAAADSLFQEKNYAVALACLNALPDSTKRTFSTGYAFREGILLLAEGQFDRAAADFETAEPDFADLARWYRALALLNLPAQKNEGFALLERLAERPGNHQQDARKLLDER